MHDDSLDSPDRHGRDDEDLHCPGCGTQLPDFVRRESTSPDQEGRPTEDECWKEFWTHLARIWISLEHEVQLECIAEAERRDRLHGSLPPESISAIGLGSAGTLPARE